MCSRAEGGDTAGAGGVMSEAGGAYTHFRRVLARMAEVGEPDQVTWVVIREEKSPSWMQVAISDFACTSQ